VLFCSGVVSTRFNAKNQRGQVVSVLGGYGRFKDKLENCDCANDLSVASQTLSRRKEEFAECICT
jgi:hypothetical protein